MMLTDKQLILATKPYAAEIRSESWKQLLITIFCIAAGYATIVFVPNLFVRIAISLVLSLLLVRMFIIYHDYLHHAILQKSIIAKIWFTLYGWYVLVPSVVWKRSHDYHHKHNSKLSTASIGSYPIMTLSEFLHADKKERAFYLFTRHPLTIFFGYIFSFLLGMCLLPFLRSPKRNWDGLVSPLFHAAVGAFVFWAGGFEVFLYLFFIPAFLSSTLGAYLFYAQHNFPGVTFKEKDGWTYSDAALISSSYMKLDPVLNWFTANIGYHHIHHANARIPFYRLPEVFKNIPEFQHATTTSLNPVDVWKCLQLKLWASERNKMITLNELKQAS